MKRIKTNSLLIFLAGLQIADGFLTYIGVTNNISQEGNPLVNHAIQLFGLEFSLTLTKLLALFTIYLMYRFKSLDSSTSIKLILTLVSLIYFYVVGYWVYIIYF